MRKMTQFPMFASMRHSFIKVDAFTYHGLTENDPNIANVFLTPDDPNVAFPDEKLYVQKDGAELDM